jgi:DNA polymerase-4
MQFLDSPIWKLKNEVFNSIVGYYWYLRLRGHEVDSLDFGRKSFGHQYALGDKTNDRDKLYKLLMKLCEKTGRRLRKQGYLASGIHLWLSFENKSHWARSQKTKSAIYSTQDIYLHSRKLLDQVNLFSRVTNIGVSVFNLQPGSPLQLGLFDDTRLDTKNLAIASDLVNDKYGEFSLVPAIMANMQEVILKRVAFGNVRDL